MYIDTHTHLFTKEFSEDIEDVIARARENGVKSFLLPNIDVSSIPEVINLSENNNNCFSMFGLHPCSVGEQWENDLKIIRQTILENQTIAIGEIGIDLYWDDTFIIQQRLAFEQQVIWAKEMKLPIAIHVRDAFDEVFEILDRQHDENLKGVFHCFTGNAEQLNKALIYKDFYIGIGGVVTFKNGGVNKIIDQVPLDRMVLETDSPYLAPTPHRGKRNESSYIPIIAKTISEILSLPIDQIAKNTTENAIKLFGKDIYE